MGYLFGQTWIWILISFVLGLIIGSLLSRLAGKKHVEVTEERVGADGGSDLSSTRRAFDDRPAVETSSGFPDRPATAGTGFGAPAAAGAAGVAAGSTFGGHDFGREDLEDAHGRHEGESGVQYDREAPFTDPSERQSRPFPQGQPFPETQPYPEAQPFQPSQFQQGQAPAQNQPFPQRPQFGQPNEPIDSDRPQPPTYQDYRIPGPQDRPPYEPTDVHGPREWGTAPEGESTDEPPFEDRGTTGRVLPPRFGKDDDTSR